MTAEDVKFTQPVLTGPTSQLEVAEIIPSKKEKRFPIHPVLSPLQTTFLKPPSAFTNRYSSPKCKCYVSHTCYGFALALMRTMEGTQVASAYVWRSARNGMTEARDVLPAMSRVHCRV